MRYPTRSWTTLPGVAVHWAEMCGLALLYVAGRRLLGLDESLDWGRWVSLIMLGALICSWGWIYGRPRKQKNTSSA